MAIPYVLAGFPGAGKSEMARDLARRTGAVWLRADSIDTGGRDVAECVRQILEGRSR